MSKKERLIARTIPFLDEIRNMTPSTQVEQWLNRTHGPGTLLYEDLARLVREGIEEGWAADVEIEGRRYRRARLCLPTPETFHFSITAVYMDSMDGDTSQPERVYRGMYHSHPYGEFNMVVPLDDGAALAGPNGWCCGGWTAPPPGSEHYPEAKGGRVVALFFLPAGRISYDLKPPA